MAIVTLTNEELNNESLMLLLVDELPRLKEVEKHEDGTTFYFHSDKYVSDQEVVMVQREIDGIVKIRFISVDEIVLDILEML